MVTDLRYPAPSVPRRLAAPRLLLSFIAAMSAGAFTHAIADPPNEGHAECQRCHAMATLGYRDPATGEVVNLAIDGDLLAHSVHGEVECVECHKLSYRRYPHPDSIDTEELNCVACHEDDPDDSPYRFPEIDAEFQDSIHMAADTPGSEDFSCHSCHDPHQFQVAKPSDGLPAIVREGNRLCLDCHEQVLDPLRDVHHWLPNRDAHWKAVRCVDCHTPPAEHASHLILSASESARNCVSCHSKDAILLNRLYSYQSEEDVARRGWLDKAIYNEAYVVGMSRNPDLDRLSLIVLGVTVLLLGAHGYGRYRASRSRSTRS